MSASTKHLPHILVLTLGLMIIPEALSKGSKNPPPATPAKTLVIGVDETDQYPEYAFKSLSPSRAKDDHGAAWEILAAFAQDARLTLNFRALPRHKLDEELRRGKIDFKFPDHPDKQLDVGSADARVYSLALFDSVEGLLMAPENKGKLKEQIKMIATAAGTTVWNYLDDVKLGKIEITEYPTVLDALQAALSGKAAAVYANITIARHHLAQMPGQGINSKMVFDSGSPFRRQSYQLSTIRYPEVVKSLDIYLTSHEAEIAKIKGKYLAGSD
jgi:Bacterial extracellular solute-binding proteins, family 3